MVKRRTAVSFEVGTANAWDDAYARWLASRESGALQMPREDVLEISFEELLPGEPSTATG